MFFSFGVALFSLALAQLSVAQNPASVGNCTTTTNRPTAIGNLSFTSQPRGRGTVGIIVSCSITFVFCVWTAVHPDIIANATPYSRILYKATMMLVSIIVPEGVIMCAVGQLREARRINKAWQEKFPDRKDQGYLDMDGAFFVVMGGFVIKCAEKSRPRPECRRGGMPCLCGAIRRPDFWVGSSDDTATLTPTGFLNYLNEGSINCKSFDKREIVDKGKANSMSKLISCLQAVWLIVASVGRLVKRLPLTLLEFHVLIQVVCTIAIIFCWWNKPLNVNEPIAIKLQTPCDGYALGLPLTDQTEVDKERLEEDPEEDRGEDRPLSRNFIVKRCPSNFLAIIAKAFYDILVYVDGPTVPAASNTKSGSQKRTSCLVRVPPVLMEGIIVGAVGLLHMVAWNSHFPTSPEKWLWRITSTGMCFFPLVNATIASSNEYQKDLAEVIWKVHLGRYCIPGLLVNVVQEIRRVASERGKVYSMRLAHVCLIICCLFVQLAYALCVIYITVESYASVRDPPEGTMVTPEWSNYWPHV